MKVGGIEAEKEYGSALGVTIKPLGIIFLVGSAFDPILSLLTENDTRG